MSFASAARKATILSALIAPAFALALAAPSTPPSIPLQCGDTRELSIGMQGQDVADLQRFLISQGLLAADDDTGYFGPLTENAVERFQSMHGIVSYGTPATTGYGAVGPRTRELICEIRASATALIPPTASTTDPAAAATNTIDVFIIAGQSNAVGETMDPTMANVPSVPAGIAYQYMLTPNTDAFCGSQAAPAGLSQVVGNARIGEAHCGNMWSQFAITYNQQTGHKVVFVATAVPGSSLIASIQQYVGAPDNWDMNQGTLFGKAITAATSSLTALEQQGFTPQIKGVLWIQGESDALAISAGKISQTDYENALKQLIQNFRNQLGVDIPFYVFQIGSNLAYYPTDYPGYGSVRSADNDVENPTQGIYVVSREALLFAGNLGAMADTVHYNQYGHNLVGDVGARNVVRVQQGLLPLAPADGIVSIVNPSGSTTVNFAAFLNNSNSCASSTYSISYGEESSPGSQYADDIPIPTGMCGPVTAHFSHTYAQPGTYTYRLDTTSIASHHAGNPFTVVQQGTVTISSPPPTTVPPPTCAINFSPATGAVGQTAGLYWSSYNTTAVTIDRVGTSLPTTGSTLVTIPSIATAYTLTVLGKDGTTRSCSATIGQAGSPPPAGNGPIDVFLVAGQSNAQGVGDASQSPRVPSGVVLQYSNNTISDANDPVGNASTGSAWPQFGITYNQLTGHKVLFVPSASGGSSLLPQYAAPGDQITSGGTWSPLGGRLFSHAVGNLMSAMSLAQSAGYTPQFMGILWAQGENEAQQANGAADISQYPSALQTLVQDFRSSLSAYNPQIPFYIFETGSMVGANDVGFGVIRNYESSAESPSANIYMVSREPVTFLNLGMMGNQGIHYSQSGYNDDGMVGAQNVVRAQLGQPLQTGKSNQIASITANNGTVTFVGFVNSSNSCNSSPYSISYGDSHADTITVPQNICGPYVFATSHTYAQSGTYTIQLSQGATVLQTTNYAVQVPPPAPPTPAPSCGLEISPNPTGPTGNVGIYWQAYNSIAATLTDSAGNTYSSLQMSGNTMFPNAAPRSYTLTVRNASGQTAACTASATK